MMSIINRFCRPLEQTDWFMDHWIGDGVIRYLPSSSSLSQSSLWLRSATDEAYTYEFDVPGVPKDKIVIDVENRSLSISAVHEQRSYVFKVALREDAFVNDDAIDATLKDGVLIVKVSRKQAPRTSVRIRSDP